MATGERSRRGGARISEVGGVSQKSRLITRETPEYGSSQAGLESLGASFQNFFNKAQGAIDSVSAAVHANELADIEQVNKEQQAEATAKALSGDSLTSEELLDRDYTEVYTATTGRLEGARMASEFALSLNQLPVDGAETADAAAQRFLQENFHNGSGVGTGDALFDASVLATFQKSTAEAIEAHRGARLKHQLAKGQQRFTEDIESNAHLIVDPQQLMYRIEDAKSSGLFATNPQGAASAAISSYLKGAHTRQEIAQRLHVLETPFGAEGRSMLQAIPSDAADAIREDLVKRQLGAMSIDGKLAMSDLEKQFQDAKTATQLMQMLPALDDIVEKHGGQEHAKGFRARILTQIDKVTTLTAERESVILAAASGNAQAPALVRKHFPFFMEEAGITMRDNPEAVAMMGAQFQNIFPESVSNFYGNAIAQNSDPEQFAIGMRFLTAIGGDAQARDKAVTGMLSSEASAVYLLASKLAADGRDWAQVHLEIANAPGGVSDPDTFKRFFSRATGEDTESAGQLKFEEQITSHLNEEFGTSNVSVPTLKAIREYAKTIMVTRNVSDYNTATEIAVKAMAPRLGTQLNADGDVVVGKSLIPFSEGSVQLGKDILNPSTGTFEDTAAIVKTDLEVAKGMFSTAEDGSTFSPNNPLADLGLYMLTNPAGLPVAFQPGMTTTIAGEPFVVPETAEEFEKMLQAHYDADGTGAANLRLRDRQAGTPRLQLENPMSSRMGIGVINTSNGPVFTITHKPGFEHSLPSQDELAADNTSSESVIENPDSRPGGGSVIGEGDPRSADEERRILEEAGIDPDASSKFITVLKEGAQKKAADDVIDALRNDGRLPASSGVAKPVPDDASKSIKNLDELLQQWRNDLKEKQGGTAIDGVSTAPNASYARRRFAFLEDSEGSRSFAYDDATGRTVRAGRATEGNVTVGIGFNMEAPGARERWEQAGLEPAAFDEVRAGKKSLSSRDQRNLFDVSIGDAEEFVKKRAAGVPLQEHERLALLSMAFHSPALIPAGGVIHAALLEGDKEAVLHDILYGNNPSGNKGIARRRYAEAAQWVGPVDAKKVLPKWRDYIRKVQA